jgi:hemerythrin-like domain-containing protein
MKTATESLQDDHVHILRLTEVMKRITYDKTPDITTLENIVDIIRNFADGIHHSKEEDIFFPLLGNRGFSASSGPVAVMVTEHVMGRNFVKGMEQNILLYKNGQSDALGKIYDNMKGYAELLQSHISKENNILFRMADKVLTQNDHENLLKEFSKAESSRVPSSEYINKIDNLAALYQIKY